MDENAWQHSVAGKDVREHEVVDHHSSSVGAKAESWRTMYRPHSTYAEAWKLYRDEAKVDVNSRLEPGLCDHSHAVNVVFPEPAVAFEVAR